MRLWTLHPKYLDAQGLVALWRESLLARAVLLGKTRGYTRHPQLERFKADADPGGAINAYLTGVFDESLSRGYSFDKSKLAPAATATLIAATSGQIAFEWRHLKAKLRARSPVIFERWEGVLEPQPHPLFYIFPGEIETWERGDVIS